MTTEKPRTETPIQPVVKEISVPLAREQAFALFTEGIAGWWPLATHSVAGSNAVGCHFEPRAGGRLLETAADGTQHVWGTLLAWEPPVRLVVTWHPGRQADTGQELAVSFSPEGDGTRVRLVHTGWERLGDVGPRERDDYDPGWDYVLSRYVEAVKP